MYKKLGISTGEGVERQRSGHVLPPTAKERRDMPMRAQELPKSMIRKLWGEFNGLFHEEAGGQAGNPGSSEGAVEREPGRRTGPDRGLRPVRTKREQDHLLARKLPPDAGDDRGRDRFPDAEGEGRQRRSSLSPERRVRTSYERRSTSPLGTGGRSGPPVPQAGWRGRSCDTQGIAPLGDPGARVP